MPITFLPTAPHSYYQRNSVTGCTLVTLAINGNLRPDFPCGIVVLLRLYQTHIGFEG